MNLLKASDFIQMQVAAGKVTYRRTEAGREFIKYFNKIVLLLDPNISTPFLI